MELDETVTQLGVTKVVYHANMNIYIYLHHPGQYMDVDSKSKVCKLFISEGHSKYYNVIVVMSKNNVLGVREFRKESLYRFGVRNISEYARARGRPALQFRSGSHLRRLSLR